jgi:hypothetical protein
MHGCPYALEHGIEELPRLLRVAVGHQLHRAFQVSEPNRHLLAFTFYGALGGQDLLGQQYLLPLGLSDSQGGQHMNAPSCMAVGAAGSLVAKSPNAHP